MKNINLNIFNLKSSAKLPKLGESAETDWKIIFITFSSAALIIVIVCTLLYLAVNRGDIYNASKPNEQEKPFNVDAIKRASLYYEEKALKFDSIKNASSSTLIDPSL